jgi:hypothetical protein
VADFFTDDDDFIVKIVEISGKQAFRAYSDTGFFFTFSAFGGVDFYIVVTDPSS